MTFAAQKDAFLPTAEGAQPSIDAHPGLRGGRGRWRAVGSSEMIEFLMLFLYICDAVMHMSVILEIPIPTSTPDSHVKRNMVGRHEPLPIKPRNTCNTWQQNLILHVHESIAIDYIASMNSRPYMI